MRIGVIACDMIKRELDAVIGGDSAVAEVVYLEAALHIHPEKMRVEIIARAEEMAPRVDAIFLGYGFCQSLRGIEDAVSVPVVMPQLDDCISILFGPERYAEETKREVGTWFMTSGWTEVSQDMVIKELKLERALKYGRDPMELAKRLFTHYRRGLFIDTGVGDADEFRAHAHRFCDDFGLRYEETAADSSVLRDEFRRCKELCGRCGGKATA